MDVQLQVGIGDADVRTFASLLSHLVNDGILHLVGHKFRVAEFRAEHNAIDGKGRFIGQVFCPVNLLHSTIHLVGTGGAEVFDGFQNFDGGAQLKICAIEQFLVACEGHHAATYLDVVGPEVYELRCQYCLQALKGLGNHFKFHE